MATSAISMDCAYADAYTIEQLGAMIQARTATISGETTETAVRATAINILTSLSGQTTTKKEKSVVLVTDGGAGVATFERTTALHTSFDEHHKRCLRVGASSSGYASAVSPWPKTCVQLVDPARREWLQAHVYKVTLAVGMKQRWPFQPSTFYVVARDESVVKAYLERRFTNVANKTIGAAKHALRMASAKVSQRPLAGGTNGKNAARVAASHTTVKTSGNGYGSGQFAVDVSDDLLYAKLALKEGPASVNLAFQKAANRTAGIINNWISKAGSFKDKVTTPFPEIASKAAK